jgi:hypothetical protein
VILGVLTVERRGLEEEREVLRGRIRQMEDVA